MCLVVKRSVLKMASGSMLRTGSITTGVVVGQREDEEEEEAAVTPRVSRTKSGL